MSTFFHRRFGRRCATFGLAMLFTGLCGARAPLAPTIAIHPADTTVTTGQSATFLVAACGSAPFSFQWLRDGVQIDGAITASYTTAPLAEADNGARISVVVGNAAGEAATSSSAALTVVTAVGPAIMQQPASARVAVGATVTFAVAAEGADLAYQWRRNGVDIAGATAASYTTAPAGVADDGARFSVVVTNAAQGATISIEATLSVFAGWGGVIEDGAPGLARDLALAVAADWRGNVVIGGTSDAGDFPGDPAGLRSNAYVAKYGAGGTREWVHRFPVPGNFGVPDVAAGVATDSVGNVYAAGSVQGTFAGQIHAGGIRDVAVLKYDSAGNLLWARQVGSDNEDFGRAIAVDAAGNVFVVGNSQGQLPLQPPAVGELFIAKFDTNGNRLWIRQWGSLGEGANRDVGRGVALDAAGNAYMTGYIPRPYGGTTPGGTGDGFAAKYDGAGNQLWFSRIRGLGPDDANAIAVAADGNTIYLTGSTNSDFELPDYPPQSGPCCDVFIARLDGSGAIQWIHNLSSVPQPLQANFNDIGTAVATDPCGSAAFVTGHTAGVMPGQASLGAQDIFVARYEGGGALGWVRQFGAGIPAQATRNDAGHAVTVDRRGDLVVAGETIGTFGAPNPNTDRADWFLMKLRPADGSVY
ncbi:MAG: SBBP repeat-containing protein [Pseudomonadota bacterium]